MYRLITFLFSLAVLSLGCKKSDDRMTAAMYESKLKEASQQAHRLVQEKHAKSGKIGEAMTAQETASFMTESEAVQIVQPLIDPSIAFLQSNYDINILNYFPAGSPKIAQIGALAMRLNQLEMQGKSVDTSNFINWFVPQIEVENQANGEILSYAQPSLADCALDALGIPAALIVGSAKNLTRAAILKAAATLVARTMTWIGTAIAIYDFGSCMDWW
jgi:hypothetical protein